MHVASSAYWLPKAGNEPQEYEDAYWPPVSVSPEESLHVFRCAIADGATEASYAREWAQALVREYCDIELTPDEDLGRLIEAARKRWVATIETGGLPWYAEEKLRSGAFSSLLGITLDAGSTWSTRALGDSCIFQVRGDELIEASPLKRSDEFSSRPLLLSTGESCQSEISQSITQVSGEWRNDDTFFLMTDALACWFLKSCEQGQTPWSVLRDLDTDAEQAPFASLVHELRSNGALRNDDVTLVRIEIWGGSYSGLADSTGL